MKILTLDNSNTNQAKYLQLVEAIRNAIRQRYLVAGDALPSVKSLAEDLHLNRHTIMKSFAELVAQGWIESRQRVGYKVVSHLPIEKVQVRQSPECPESTMIHRFVRAGSALPPYPESKFDYNFSGGLPDLSRFPFDEFKRGMSDVLLRPNLDQMTYGQSAGTDDLIAQVERYLRQSRAITDRQIVITNGSQEALFIVAQLLLQSGDKVAVEALGYPPAMAAFTSAGAQLVGIKQDHQGICPDDLAMQIKLGNIRLIYLTPLHQYPTTVTLPMSRRMAIYRLAAKHSIPIVEDDYDHEFHYRCQPLAPMAADDPAQLIIYLSSFSKIMFPGARVGVMALSKTMAKAVTEYRLLISHKSNVLMQAALAKWMKSGGFERHLRRSTRINLQRRDHAVAVLNSYDCFDFVVPDGGMALWVKLKSSASVNKSSCGAELLASRCQKLNVYLQHEGQFHLNKQHNQDRFIRLGFAGMCDNDFAKGMKLVVSALDDYQR
jgi:GntR family transcriptional regulator/MocR family aminotransferase